MQILSRSKKKISQHLSGIKKYYASPEIRVSAPDTQKFLIVERIKEYFRTKYKISDIDGVKVFFENGWGLVRASNTEASLVIRFEATTADYLEEIKEVIMKEVEKNLK